MKIKLLQTRMNNRKAKRGFTLVELLIYLGIFSGFVTLLSGLFIAILDAQQDMIQNARLEQDMHYLFSRIQYDVARAQDLILPASNGAVETELHLNIGGNIVSYYLESDKLKILEEGSTALSLNSYGVLIDSIEFQRLANTNGKASVRVSLDLKTDENDTSLQEQQSMVSTFGLR